MTVSAPPSAESAASATGPGRIYPLGCLPGAECWVAGAAAARVEGADVELDEVERFCTEHHLETNSSGQPFV